MPKPEPMNLNDLIGLHKEEFVKYELWVSEDLAQHLVESYNLDAAFTTVVVDLDEEEPVGPNVDGAVALRLNGRFYMPLEDKQGAELNLTADEWFESTKEWFDDNGISVTLDEDSDDMIKFTAFVPALEVPGPEAPAEEEPDEEAPADEESDEEPADDEAADDEPVQEDEDAGGDNEDLKEFEDALGL